ncbi:MAG: hypothetical protein IPP91_13120 [Betaproteobacteria bacterium]|nr:hypothetical protein [Betaproteobacteria bacterium]
MNKFNFTALAAAFCLAMSTGAIGATLSKAEHKSAKEDVESRYKSEAEACKAMSGNTKDICIEEAKGRAKISKAELEASFSPSDKHSYDVRVAKADAAYGVAKEKCDDFAGNAKDVCRKEAKSAHVAAKANAKLAEKTADANASAAEKTNDAKATARAKTNDAVRDATAEKAEAAYAVAKQKCDAYAGDAKANCIKDAKVRYGQS